MEFINKCERKVNSITCNSFANMNKEKMKKVLDNSKIELYKDMDYYMKIKDNIWHKFFGELAINSFVITLHKHRLYKLYGASWGVVVDMPVASRRVRQTRALPKFRKFLIFLIFINHILKIYLPKIGHFFKRTPCL